MLHEGAALKTALRCEAKIFMMQPVVRQSVDRTWYGQTLSQDPNQAGGLLYAYHLEDSRIAGVMYLPVIVLANVALSLLLLPLVAVYPPLVNRLTSYWELDYIDGSGVRKIRWCRSP